MEAPCAAPLCSLPPSLALRRQRGAQASIPIVARSIAASCANCHGTNGVSRGRNRSLAGRRKDDIIRTMQEFKAGTKPGTIMPQLAKGYTDAQIELAAGWFAAQKAGK